MSVELSVVIPCYKSGSRLNILVGEIEKQLKGEVSYEVLLICDASPDDTWSRIEEIATNSRNVKGFLLGRNVGQQSATMFGILQSQGSQIVTMDDDGQHQAKSIKELRIALLTQGKDLIYAIPLIDEHSASRNFLSRSVKRVLARWHFIQHAKVLSAFRIFDRRIIDSKEKLEFFDGPLDSLLSLLTSRIGYINVDMLRREEGKSNYNFFQLAQFAINLFIRSSNRSINLITMLGIFGSIVCLILFFSIFSLYLVGKIAIPGYTSIIAIVTLGFFLNFVVIGFLGNMIYSILMSQQRVSSVWVRSSTKP